MRKEILEVEAVEISPLEQTIETTLVKANVTDAVINALGEKYGGLQLKSLDDKEGYLIIKESRKEVRKIGVITEKLCKQGREDAIAVQKKWLAKEKEILGKIAKVQDPLDAEIKKYEDEVARKEKEEQEKKEREYMARQTTLLKMEAKYENDCFTLGNVSYEIANIKEADKEIWEETILPKFKREFEKIETVRAEEERQKEAAAAKLREEQAELQRQQEELNRQREEMRLQQEQLQKQQEEANRAEIERKEKEANAIREKQDAQNKARMQQVMALGLNYSGEHKSFIYQDVNVAEVDIVTYSAEQWDKMISDITPIIAKKKEDAAKEAEEKRLADIESAKQLAIQQEQERIAEENRQAEIKRQQDEQRRLEEQAKASDKEKWDAFTIELAGIEFPQFKSAGYKNKIAIAKEKIEEIQAL